MKRIIKIIAILSILSLYCSKPEDFLGVLEIKSDPEGATVYINGKEVGKTNMEIELPPGEYTVKLTKTDYIDYEKSITVESGKQAELSVALQRSSITEHGLTFAHVLAGWFTMGSEDSDAWDDEKPEHQVYLDGYYISKYEVTNAQYCKFLNAIGVKPEDGNTGYVYYNGEKICWIGDGDDWDEQILYDGSRFYVKGGYEDYPVIYVTWYGAKAFCEYYGWRLPTEAEWEKAARGTDGRKYPWGNSSPNSNLANYDDNVGHTTPVGSYPQGASPYGCTDMAGNVWEWCNDWYDEDYYENSPDHNPKGPSSGSYRVLRGGGWYSGVGYIRCAYRNYSAPSRSWGDVGFRPVRDE